MYERSLSKTVRQILFLCERKAYRLAVDTLFQWLWVILLSEAAENEMQK